MTRLPEAFAMLDNPGFAAALKRDLEGLGAHGLPLQQGLRQASHVADRAPEVSVLGIDAAAGDGVLRARVGVFFSGVIAGCNCADDPTPMDELSEYCELDVEIARADGAARIRVRDD